MKKLILSEFHKSIGGKMVNFSGYYMPIHYKGIISEHLAVRNSVGLFDVSHMGEIFISGNDAEKLLQFITSNNIEKIKEGQVQYSCLLNEKGGIVDDLLIYKLKINQYMLVVNAANIEKDYKWICKNNEWNCSVDNFSEKYSLLALQGPNSLKLLQEITKNDISKINYYEFIRGNIGDLQNLIISRTGYTGELGFEIYVKNDDVKILWDLMFKTNIHLEPIGLAARDTLRLEKGYCLYGNEINDQTTPIEAGLGWITDFNNDFIAKDSLLKKQENGFERRLIGLVLREKGIARKDYEIFNSNNQNIGIITSGSISPSLKKPIALAYIDTKYNEGDTVYIEIRKKKLEAIITKYPFL